MHSIEEVHPALHSRPVVKLLKPVSNSALEHRLIEYLANGSHSKWLNKKSQVACWNKMIASSGVLAGTKLGERVPSEQPSFGSQTAEANN